VAGVGRFRRQRLADAPEPVAAERGLEQGPAADAHRHVVRQRHEAQHYFAFAGHVASPGVKAGLPPPVMTQ
jgi:hypothetical protein